ncbi:hypothetical protein Hanom_Chr04g00324551 [Helianthus anomalus]
MHSVSISALGPCTCKQNAHFTVICSYHPQIRSVFIFHVPQFKLNIKYTDGPYLWLTKILDLVPSFLKVHGWSLWFALC